MENLGLLAPESYWKMSHDEMYELTNGCGPEKATDLISNSIFGADLKLSCDIHDYTYARPSSVTNRKDADELFLKNLNRTVSRSLKSPFLKFAAGFLAKVYFYAVRIFGERYFKPDEASD